MVVRVTSTIACATFSGRDFLKDFDPNIVAVIDDGPVAFSNGEQVLYVPLGADEKMVDRFVVACATSLSIGNKLLILGSTLPQCFDFLRKVLARAVGYDRSFCSLKVVKGGFEI